MSLRYGENPHQQAALYAAGAMESRARNNCMAKSFRSITSWIWMPAGSWCASSRHPAAAIIKHTNPAGCAEQGSLAEAYRKALECDPVSAYGGVIGFNRELDEETAGEVAKLFVEAIAAPAFSEGGMAILRAKKNLRLVRVTSGGDGLVVKSISGGYLAQTADLPGFDRSTAQVKTRRALPPMRNGRRWGSAGKW